MKKFSAFAVLIVGCGLFPQTSLAQHDGSVWFPSTLITGGLLQRVAANGTVTTFPGKADAVAFGDAGLVYVADKATGEIATYDATGKIASKPWPNAFGIQRCPDGSFWVLDSAAASNTRFTRISATGTVLAGPTPFALPFHHASVDAAGNLWVVQIFTTTELWCVHPDGTAVLHPVPFTSPGLATLYVAADRSGHLFVSNNTSSIHVFDVAFNPLPTITAPTALTFLETGRGDTLVGWADAAKSVVVLNKSGSLVRAIPTTGFSGPLTSAYACSEAPDGTFWVSGTVFLSMESRRFATDGTLLQTVANAGNGTTQGDVTGRARIELAPVSSDTDGDGVANRAEFEHGFDALNGSSTPNAMTASAGGSPQAGVLSYSIHAPAYANRPFFIAVSLTPGFGLALDPPYSVPSLPLGADALLSASLRNAPLRPGLGGTLDGTGKAFGNVDFDSALSGRTIYVSAVIDSLSRVPAATSPVEVTMP